MFSTLSVSCTSGLREYFNLHVEKSRKLINHSTELTVISTVFTVENVENYSLICTKKRQPDGLPHIYADIDEKITICCCDQNRMLWFSDITAIVIIAEIRLSPPEQIELCINASGDPSTNDLVRKRTDTGQASANAAVIQRVPSAIPMGYSGL